jgi:hypothetical protein
MSPPPPAPPPQRTTKKLDLPPVYALPRNDLEAALDVVKRFWGRLQPEDLTVLFELQDDPQPLTEALARLTAEWTPAKGPPTTRAAR